MTDQQMLDAVIPLLKRLEGFRAKPYPDGKLPNRQQRYSWGYGTLWNPDKGNETTEENATREMQDHLKGELTMMKATCPNYYGTPFGIALLSKGYQYGGGIFKLYNNLPIDKAVVEFNNADDKPYYNRRVAELDLYRSLSGTTDVNKGVVAFVITALLIGFLSYVTFK